MGAAVEQQVLVHFVGDGDDVVFDAQPGDLGEVAVRQDGAGRLCGEFTRSGTSSRVTAPARRSRSRRKPSPSGTNGTGAAPRRHATVARNES